MNKTLGLILIVFGLVALAWGGFQFTTKEKAVDLGPVEISKEKKHTVPLPPLVGGAALVGGVVLLASRK